MGMSDFKCWKIISVYLILIEYLFISTSAFVKLVTSGGNWWNPATF